MTRAREVPDQLPPQERVQARIRGILPGFEQRPRCYRLHVSLRTAGDADAAELIARTELRTRARIAADLMVGDAARADDIALMLWAIAEASLPAAINRDGNMADAYRGVDRFIDPPATPLRWLRD